jgi:hypothetical protein
MCYFYRSNFLDIFHPWFFESTEVKPTGMVGQRYYLFLVFTAAAGGGTLTVPIAQLRILV